MADAYNVTVLRQKVFHDGLSMRVLKPGGENPPVSAEHIGGLVDEGVIEKPDGWAPTVTAAVLDLPSADGPVFTLPPAPGVPTTADLVVGLPPSFFEELGNSDVLRGKGLVELINIAIAEGVMPDPEGFRIYLIDAIEEKRVREDSLGELIGEDGQPLNIQLSDSLEPLPLNLTDEERANLPPLDPAGGGEPVVIHSQTGGQIAEAYIGNVGGQTVGAGSAFDHDGDGKEGGSLPHDPPALTGKSKAELIAIADAEDVPLEDGMTNKAIVAAIEEKRAIGASISGLLDDDDDGEGAPPA